MVAYIWMMGVRAAAAADVGDVYVTGPEFAAVFVDGEATGIVAPGVVPDVPAGPHLIRVDRACDTGELQLNVRANAVEKVEIPVAVGLGTLTVVTNPAGATVHAPRGALGVAPLMLIPAPCGTYQLRATFAGHGDAAAPVTVPLRGHVDLSLELFPVAVGAVAVAVQPLNAAISLDGLSRGVGPMTIDDVDVGAHVVRATLKGYHDLERSVVVAPDKVVRADFLMQPLPPPDPWAVQVGLDRVRWGRLGANVGATVLSAGLGALAWTRYASAEQAYSTYAALNYDDDPQTYYQAEVGRPRSQAIALGIGAGLVGVGAGALWATGDLVTPRAGPSVSSPLSPSTP